MDHFLPDNVFQIFQKWFSISRKKKGIHLDMKEEPIVYAKHSPLTLALTGSSCSFLFLPNSTSITAAGGSAVTVNRRACLRLQGNCSWAPPSLPFMLSHSFPVLLCFPCSEGLVFFLRSKGKLHQDYLCLVKGQFPSCVFLLKFNPLGVSPFPMSLLV